MKRYRIQAETIAITFTGNPFGIQEVVNRRTGEILLSAGQQAFIVRPPDQLFDPVFLTRLTSVVSIRGGYRFALADDRGSTRARLSVSSSDAGVKFSMSVSATRPTWLVEWRFGVLKLDQVILPALGGQALSSAMPAEMTLTYKYPFWWNAQFAIGAAGKGGIWLSARDKEPAFKMLRVRKEPEGFTLTYAFESTGPLKASPVAATWYLDCYAGDWRTPVELYRQWWESVRPLRPLHDNPHYPPWADPVNTVLEIWGIGKERPEPLHTYDEMLATLRRWAQLHPPMETLVYLPGFAEHGIDTNAPSYRPSAPLGGPRKFRKLIDEAHRLGFHVMLHTNVLAMTYTHPDYPRMKRHQVVDVFGRPQGWGLDMDGDWLAEPYFAYINPGARAWGDLMERTLGELIHRFNPDGIFLDQTLLAFNVSKGPNFVRGMLQHVQRLQKAFPSTLFAGEGINDMIAEALPMAQIHGIDSIAEVHALNGPVPWRTVHPVSMALFGKYTRFMAHLLTRHPSHPMYQGQEAAYAALDVMPAFCLYHNGQSMEHPALRAMLRRARRARSEP